MNEKYRTANEWIERLGLRAHPEGGFYRETYRARETIGTCCLPSRFQGSRSASTAIYFLLRGHEFSAFHRIRSDELWHFHAGSSLTIHALFEGDEGAGRPPAHRTLRLGVGSGGPGDPEGPGGRVRDPASSGSSQEVRPQVVVPAGVWFAAEVDDPAGFTLAGCTVSPGFDFDDFELGNPDELSSLFPAHRDIVLRFAADLGGASPEATGNCGW